MDQILKCEKKIMKLFEIEKHICNLWVDKPFKQQKVTRGDKAIYEKGKKQTDFKPVKRSPVSCIGRKTCRFFFFSTYHIGKDKKNPARTALMKTWGTEIGMASFRGISASSIKFLNAYGL